jgi:ParB family chromosome partitioning protein
MAEVNLESDGSVKNIEIAQIQSPKLHDRRSYSQEEIEALSKNIASTQRLLQPIVVRRVADGYERIAGFRRVEAVKLLGWESIPAVVLDEVSDEEAMLIMLSENMQREDLNPYDQTVGILQYIALSLGMDIEAVKKLLYRFRNADSGVLKGLDDKTYSQREQMEQITQRLGIISVSTLINRLKIFSLSPKVLEALKEGKIGYSAAQEINKLGDEGRIALLIDEVLKKKLPLREIKQRVKAQKSKPSKVTAPKVFYTLSDEGGWVSLVVENISKVQINKLENFLKNL